jgi:glucosamine--fructose-6-phosphate aminotransferase (isomerizing)
MEQGSHTWREIASQPAIWRATLGGFGSVRAQLQEFLAARAFDSVMVVGCGSTHYLAHTVATTLTHFVGIPAHALPASELWLFPYAMPAGETLLLPLSRSGTTTETLRALERFRAVNGGPVLAVTCYPDSPLARQADLALVAPDARENSVAQTRSFTSMLLLTLALAATLAHDDEVVERLGRLPDALENLVERLGNRLQPLGADLDIARFFFLGGGPLYGLASEIMLKTKEMTLSYSEAYHPLEFRHGPMSMVDESTLVVSFLSDTGLAEELRVLKDMRDLGARTLALTEDASVFNGWRPDNVVELCSGLSEWERSPLYLPVGQRLAYHRAIAKGLNPDRPHNLEAVVEL